ncbi:MAG: DNA polymerase III subunit epsilon [Hyphomicrobiales bacterium]|nr:DNA polymerase III subunit epsilon [Hyphomicrobiales bacterium]
MREIVLDTETTGLDPYTGDRLVELGCVELVNSLPSGETFHVYLDPERDMPEEAFRIHGLSAEFLKGKPKFGEVAQQFLDFIADAKLVIHNAEFDMKFLNHELKLVGIEPLLKDRVVDTLMIARRKFPGSPNSLDALCSRFKIDNSRRTKHGALLDSEILAEVYLELIGGRQTTFALPQQEAVTVQLADIEIQANRPTQLQRNLSLDSLEAHNAMRDQIGEKAFWKKHIKSDSGA